MQRSVSSKSTKGFTLMEVLIALAIFSAMALAMIDVTSTASYQISRLEKNTFAAWLAKNAIVERRLDDYRDKADRDIDRVEYAGQEWVVITELKPFELDAQLNFKPDLMVIDVAVAHSDNPEVPVYRMTGYMAKDEAR